MRDTRKDKEYFDKFLEYQYSRIEKKVAKLADADAEKKQRILVSLTSYEIDLLKAEFSNGASKEDIKSLLSKAVDICCEYKNMTYEDLLSLLSLTIMVENKKGAEKILKHHGDKIERDRLLNFLFLYIQDKSAIWDEKLYLDDEFKGLDKVFSSESKGDALFDYLKEWYECRSEYSWYDSHRGSLDTYCGYWSFESAAVAIALGISDEKLKKSEYYPFF